MSAASEVLHAVGMLALVLSIMAAGAAPALVQVYFNGRAERKDAER